MSKKGTKDSVIGELLKHDTNKDYSSKKLLLPLRQLMPFFTEISVLNEHLFFENQFFIEILRRTNDTKDDRKVIGLVYYYLNTILALRPECDSSFISSLREILVEHELKHPHMPRRAQGLQLYGKVADQKDLALVLQTQLQQFNIWRKKANEKKKNQQKNLAFSESVFHVIRHNLKPPFAIQFIDTICTSIFIQNPVISQHAAATALILVEQHDSKAVTTSLLQEIKHHNRKSLVLDDISASTYLIRTCGSIIRLPIAKDQSINLEMDLLSFDDEPMEQSRPAIDAATHQIFQSLLESTARDSKNISILLGTFSELILSNCATIEYRHFAIATVADLMDEHLGSTPELHQCARTLSKILYHSLPCLESFDQTDRLLSVLRAGSENRNPYVLVQVLKCLLCLPNPIQWLQPLYDRPMTPALRHQVANCILEKAIRTRDFDLVRLTCDLCWSWFQSEPTDQYDELLYQTWKVLGQHESVLDRLFRILDYRLPVSASDSDRKLLQSFRQTVYRFLGEIGGHLLKQDVDSFTPTGVTEYPDRLPSICVLQRLLEGATMHELKTRRICSSSLVQMGRAVMDVPVLRQYMREFLSTLSLEARCPKRLLRVDPLGIDDVISELQL